MKLLLFLEKPIGSKSRIEFSISGPPKKDGKGNYVRVGSWEANQWFHVAVGKTEKQTLVNVRRRLGAGLRQRGLAHRFEYI